MIGSVKASVSFLKKGKAFGLYGGSYSIFQQESVQRIEHAKKQWTLTSYCTNVNQVDQKALEVGIILCTALRVFNGVSLVQSTPNNWEGQQ